MPIDASIPALAGRGFTNQPFADQLRDFSAARVDQAREQEIRGRIVEQQRKAEDESAIQDIWRAHADDIPTALSLTAERNPTLARDLAQKYSSERANWALAAGRESETKAKQQAADVMLLQSAIGTTPENLAKVKAFITDRNPEITPLIADINDPNDERIGKLVVSGVDAAKVYEAQAKHLSEMAKGQTDGSFLRGIAGVLSVTPESEWPEILQGAAPHLGQAQTKALAGMSREELQRASLETKESMQLVETGRHNLATEGQTATAQGQTREEQARHNRVLEGQGAARVDIARQRAAEGGGASTKTRNVTSGDANKLAEYDSALNDLAVLTKDIGATGPASAVAASIPNWMDPAGLTNDAKSRQAVIDRVKQVIGKALEGGVLRREDEIKYRAILPTIGDPPAVAQAKLKGLKTALEAKKDAHLSALEDAGYNTDRFRARQAETPKENVPDVSGLRPGMKRRFANGQEWTVNASGQPVRVK